MIPLTTSRSYIATFCWRPSGPSISGVSKNERFSRPLSNNTWLSVWAKLWWKFQTFWMTYTKFSSGINSSKYNLTYSHWIKLMLGHCELYLCNGKIMREHWHFWNYVGLWVLNKYRGRGMHDGEWYTEIEARTHYRQIYGRIDHKTQQTLDNL